MNLSDKILNLLIDLENREDLSGALSEYIPEAVPRNGRCCPVALYLEDNTEIPDNLFFVVNTCDTVLYTKAYGGIVEKGRVLNPMRIRDFIRTFDAELNSNENF